MAYVKAINNFIHSIYISETADYYRLQRP